MSEACSGSCGGCTSACNDKLKKTMSKIQHKVLVLSGKGGVGKSTVAASLALTLASRGKKVGLLDVDFHGPSQPTLFGVQTKRPETTETGFLPLEVAPGVKLFSVGIVLEDSDSAIIWRGPAKMGVLKQLLEDVEWGELDYLVFDFPPGTGDEALSACQMVTGDKKAVIVTTPQEMSLADCRKCVNFCQQLSLPVTGIVENMSGFVCPDCGHRHDIFSAGGGQRMSEKTGIPLIARIPIDPAFLRECDFGNLVEALPKTKDVFPELNKIADALENA